VATGRRTRRAERMSGRARLPSRPAGLGQHLRRHHTQGESGIDDIVGQTVGGTPASLDDLVEANVTGIADPLVQGRESLAVVEVRRVDDVPCGAELGGERQNSGGKPLCVMKQNQLSH